MKAQRFAAEIRAGHKSLYGVEVPCDPGQLWGLRTAPIFPGRRGYPVVAKVGRIEFDAFVVARMRKFWLLLDGERLDLLGAEAGQRLAGEIRPRGEAPAGAEPEVAKPRAKAVKKSRPRATKAAKARAEKKVASKKKAPAR